MVAEPLNPSAELISYLDAHRLPAAFYARPTLQVARDLLGKALVCRRPEGVCAGLIVESEGYVGQEDPACHAYTGYSRRNATMWGEPGHGYVYFTYGNHWMFNAVTEESGYPAAVLVRALQPVLGLELMHERRNLHLLKGKPADRMLTNGPGKLCQAMGIRGDLDGSSLQDNLLFIAEVPPEMRLPAFETVETTRIGITRGIEFPWRYYVRGNPFVSRVQTV